MAFEVTLPRLGLTMEAGTVVEWYKHDGDEVQPGDKLYAVETDKAVQDVETPVRGTLRYLPEFKDKPVPFEIPVDTLLGYILKPGEEMPGGAGQAAPAASEAAAAPAQAPAAAAPAAGEPRGRIKVSPLARKLAEQHGIDLSEIVPEDGDKIQRKDVEAAIARKQAAAVASAPAPVTVQAPVSAPQAQQAPAPAPAAAAPVGGTPMPTSQIRRVIAQRMAESAHTTAPVTEMTEADATQLVAFRDQVKASLQSAGLPVPTYTDMIVKATALALREHPALNAIVSGDQVLQYDEVHMGIAVDTEAGLLVPVVRDVLRKSIHEIAVEARELAEKARERRASPDELQGGTFTITNLGTFGVDAFTPIINLPQVAILGVGRIVSKPAEYKGEIALRKMVTLSLTFDHRYVDGAPAARFLNRVREYIEDPYLWIMR